MGAPKWPRDLWLDAIWEHLTLRPNERVVAYVYARYAGDGDTSWASWAEISLRTGIRSKDAVWRAITGLIKSGWLTEIAPPRQHRSAVYRLTCPLDAGPGVRETDLSGVRETDSCNPEVRDSGARGPAFCDQRSGKRDTSTQIENSEENSDGSRFRARDLPDARDALPKITICRDCGNRTDQPYHRNVCQRLSAAAKSGTEGEAP